MSELRASFVIPILNEERHVSEAVLSVLAQEGLDSKEILLVLGNSTDRTDEIVAGLAAQHPEIQVLRNPLNTTPRSMNIGIEHAQYPFIVRVDAHSVLSPRYTVTAIQALLDSGAVNVGGHMRAQGDTPFEEAVAWGYNSPEGLGGAIYHTSGEAGPAESAYLGVFDRAAVREVGGFDETLPRGQDWDLNRRLRDQGGTVWFDPALEVVYRPRSTWRALARQFHATGRWRGDMIRRQRGKMPLRYFVPGALVLALAGGAGLIVCGALTRGSARKAALVVGVAPLIIYGGWVIITAARASVSSAARARLLGVLPTMHLAWGSGALMGIVWPNRGHDALNGR